jgi:integrase
MKCFLSKNGYNSSKNIKGSDMAEKRKNSKGQNLPTGIDEPESGLYRGRTTIKGVLYTVYGSSITEAKNLLAKERVAVLEGGKVKKSGVTFEQHLALWLEGKAKTRAVKTVDGYRYTISHYLTPELKALKIQSITPQVLRTFWAGLPAALKPATLKQISAVIHGCLQDAYTLELIPKNPASVARPTLERSKDAPEEEEAYKAFTPPEARRFLAACREDRWGMLFEFILATGVRRGEALGLRWPNVDLERGQVRIWESLTVVNGKATRTAPKTSSSKRTLPMSPEALELLERVRKQSALEKEIAGRRYTPCDSVFTGPMGGIIHPDAPGRYMLAICERAGTPKQSPHALRHTYASLALRARVPVDVVSKLLGHKDITETLRTYRTVYQTELERYALSLSQLLPEES